MLMLDVTRQVIVRITDGLQLADDTKHLMHLVLGLIGQTTVRHFIQILRNLIFHSVAYAFVFLDAAVYLRELLRVVFVEQVMHHANHTLRTDSEHMHLFPCLQDRELGRRHKTTGDELELAVRIFLFRLGRDDPHHQFLQEFDEADEDTGVQHVERSVESSQNRIEFVRRNIARNTRFELYAP